MTVCRWQATSHLAIPCNLGGQPYHFVLLLQSSKRYNVHFFYIQNAVEQMNTRHFHKKEVHSGKVVGAKEQEHGSIKVLWVIKFSPDVGKCLMACLDLKHGMVLFCLKEFTLGANFGIHLGGHRVFVLNKRGILLEQSGKRPSFDTPIKHK